MYLLFDYLNDKPSHALNVIHKGVEEVWNRISAYAGKYDAAIFSVSKFAKQMPLDEFIITPTIDPLSEKNNDLTADEINDTSTCRP